MKICGILRKWELGEWEGCHRYSAAGLGMRQKDVIECRKGLETSSTATNT